MQHNGLRPPAGSVISSFGVRKYHTLKAPISEKNATNRAERVQETSARPGTWPLREQEGQQRDQERRQPARKPTGRDETTPQPKQELATQTEPSAQLAVNHTQTDPVTSRWASERAPVDVATSPVNFPLQGPREVVLQSSGSVDYRRVLSKHSDDFWDARRSMSIVLSDDDEVGSLPTPFPPKQEQRTKHVGVMTDRNESVERKHVVEKTTQSTQVTLPATQYVYNAVPRVRRHVQLVRRHQPQPLPPIYIIQPTTEDSDSDDESTRFHGPHYPQFPVYPMNTNYPYPYNNIGHQQFPHIQPIRNQDYLSETTGSHRMQVELEYGTVANGLGSLVLPVAVQEELYKEYGHIKSTEVTIIKHNGNFSIHNHSVRSSQD